MHTQRRYPGVVPFQAHQSHLFFGRDEDIENLYDLTLLEKMVVLFGKSGYGKSSLLNAGVLPRFAAAKRSAERFRVVEVRFTAWTDGRSHSPLDTLHRLMGAKDAADGPATLWELFRQQGDAPEGQFLLVFDQFEEFFTYPPEQQRAFRWQLAELLFSTLPQSVRERLDALPEAERQRYVQPLQVKAVFSIRADRMSLLDGLKDALPTILHRRYELSALNRQQARAALTEPARKTGDFASPPFCWTDAALARVLDTFARDKQGREVGVEAFLLQVLAQNVETRVLNGTIADRDGDGTPDVSPGDLPDDLSNIFSEYYQNKLDELPAAAQPAARLLIEDGLVFATDTGDARRLSTDADVLMQRFRATPALLKALEDTFLVRREANTTGGFNYELSHDTLLAPVVEAAKARREAERRQAEQEKLRIEAEEQNRQLAEERRKRRQSRNIAIGAIALSLLAFGALAYALVQQSALRKTTARVVASMRLDAQELVLQLEYDKAWNKLGEACALGEQKDSVAFSLMELAYFYNESFQWNKAQPAALQVAGMLENKALQQQIEVITNGDTMQKREQLRTILRNCDTLTFDFLEKRYYPFMLSIPAGRFQMGGSKAGDEMPVHEVKLSAFTMAETETTFFQWNLYVAAIKSKITKFSPSWGIEGHNPVVNVSWYDAVRYANWLSEQNHKTPVYSIDTIGVVSLLESANGFRLPTEAEWEYAAKNAGRDTFLYAGSNNLDTVAWYYNNSSINGVYRTHSVKDKLSNALGLYDMSGNVWEWCWDRYGNYPTESTSDWLGPDKGEDRVHRGGSWLHGAERCRAANRNNHWPPLRNNDLGFRLALQ